jgi:PhoPQ-activated pathogenicity-related protein
MPHQLEMWGKYSPQIDDYTRRGLQEKLATEQGQRLGTMVDPYSYLDRLTMPKLIVNGTNDPYWTVDALNLYWDDLPGEKLVLYAPNSGHGLDDRVRVLNTMINFSRLVAAGEPLPHLTWSHEQADGKARLTISSQPTPVGASLWVARADECDFRPVQWEALPMEDGGDGFVGEQPVPDEGHMAVFGEATYEIGGRQFKLSTQIAVYSAGQQ